MSRERPLLIPARPGASTVHLRFDEALVDAREGDTVATALISAGVLMTSRSPKYRRPRGAYCLSGDCGTCLVRVDGQPNVRACMTPALEGMRVSSQNTYRPRRLDPTQLVDRLFPGGIDHHHLMIRPRIANQVMQELARNLTGYGELPEGAPERSCEHVELELPALVIGAGPAGRAAARALATAGIDHLLVDRHDLAQLEAHARADGTELTPPEGLLAQTGVFGIYPGPRHDLGGPKDEREDEWEDERAIVAASEHDLLVERLHTLRPRHLVFAVGTRDSMLPFANNDLPGVVAARGLIRALHRAEARIAGACVVIGEGEWAERQREALDALRSDAAPKVELVAPGEVVRAVGHERVEGLIRRGGRTSCALLAVAAAPAQAHELPAQAGARLRYQGSGFAVVRDASGRCGRLGGTVLWAAGDVAEHLGGHLDPEAAARDGARIGAAVCEALADEPDAHLGARRVVPSATPAPPPMRERDVVGDTFAETDPKREQESSPP